MYPNVKSRWWVRGATFALSALVAASATYWVLQVVGGSAASAVPAAALPSEAPIDAHALARVLGGGVAASAAPSAPLAQTSGRYALLGVVADRSSSGVALIAVDGKTAKPFRVGETVANGLVLQSVTGRRAVLATAMDAPAGVTLDLPPLSK